MCANFSKILGPRDVQKIYEILGSHGGIRGLSNGLFGGCLGMFWQGFGVCLGMFSGLFEGRLVMF